jgi:hypothetical protein
MGTSARAKNTMSIEHRHPTLCPIALCKAKHVDGACDENNCEEWVDDKTCNFCEGYPTTQEFQEFLDTNEM